MGEADRTLCMNYDLTLRRILLFDCEDKIRAGRVYVESHKDTPYYRPLRSLLVKLGVIEGLRDRDPTRGLSTTPPINPKPDELTMVEKEEYDSDISNILRANRGKPRRVGEDALSDYIKTHNGKPSYAYVHRIGSRIGEMVYGVGEVSESLRRKVGA